MKRYKYGYTSDEWGMNRSLGLIEDSSGDLVKYSDVKNLIKEIMASLDPTRQLCSRTEEYLRYYWMEKIDEMCVNNKIDIKE